MRWGWLPREPIFELHQFSCPPPTPHCHPTTPPGMGVWRLSSLVANDFINLAYLVKSPLKKKQQQQKENRVSENFQVVKQLEKLGGWCTWEGHESFLLLLIYLAPCISVPELCVLVTWSCLTLFNFMDYNQPDSVHGIFQARILVWVAISFSRELSKARIKPRCPALQADSLPSEHELYCIIINS